MSIGKTLALAFTSSALVCSAVLAQQQCSREFIEREVLTTPTNAQNATVRVGCNITLRPDDLVRKRLLFEGSAASGLTLDCSGATLDGGKGRFDWRDIVEIKSRQTNEATWDRPQNVQIRNCSIIGSVRVWGRCPNSDCSSLIESSSRPRHTQRMRESAPRYIGFENITLTGTGRNPFYFGPGVSDSKLLNSEVKGVSEKVGIYLDAESTRNVIDGNYIHVRTAGDTWYGRKSEPLIAVDGSSYNRIINNYFSSLNHGGIYLYRNCGFKGVSRHATPSHNMIINNIFYYNKYKGSNRAVHVGAHDGKDWRTFPTFGTCTADDDHQYGSGVSNRDHAQHNVVMQNQIYVRAPNDLIQIGRGGIPFSPIQNEDAFWGATAKYHLPVYIDHNETVTGATVNRSRRAGCFIEADRSFLEHGETRTVVRRFGDELCYREDRCNNSVLELGAPSECGGFTEVPFGCRVEGDNNGCEAIARCPTGQSIAASKAVCNLEFGAVDQGLVDSFANDRIFVAVESDVSGDGICRVGDNEASTGVVPIRSVNGLDSVRIGCREHDKNGGDCDIKGALYCRIRPPQLIVRNVVQPPGDPGRFDLQIDGATHQANAASGATVGPVIVGVGEHTVGIVAGNGTSLADYTTEASGECSRAGKVTLADGEKKTCIVTQTAKSGEAACTANCSGDRDICLEDGFLLPRQCAQIFNACLVGCGA